MVGNDVVALVELVRRVARAAGGRRRPRRDQALRESAAAHVAAIVRLRAEYPDLGGV